jgi:hypothetical protein
MTFDLRDFFPSFKRPRIAGFLASRGVPANVADMLAVFATAPRQNDHRELVQGAPTSPTITNILSRGLDARLHGFATARGAVYTRYSDDLTFSWRADPGAAVLSLARNIVPRIASAEGFHAYRSRTMFAHDRQMVTGYVVNAEPGAAPARVPREHVRAVKKAAHEAAMGRCECADTWRGRAAHVAKADPSKSGVVDAFRDCLQCSSEQYSGRAQPMGGR